MVALCCIAFTRKSLHIAIAYQVRGSCFCDASETSHFVGNCTQSAAGGR